MDEREEARRAAEGLARAESTARRLAPLWGVKDWRSCASCGAQTKVVKRLADGAEVPICGECALREMDEDERHQEAGGGGGG